MDLLLSGGSSVLVSNSWVLGFGIRVEGSRKLGKYLRVLGIMGLREHGFWGLALWS